MAFAWRHGDYARRDCDDCQKWVFSDGEIYRDGDGNAIPTPSPPRCENAPCGSREAKPQLDPWMSGVVRLWRQCRAYRALPRAGGVADQDGFLMELFEALDALRDEIEIEEIEKARARK